MLLLWCLKEALSKALRCGLTVPFGLLEVASLVPLPGGVRARFENFSQYEGIAFCAAPFCLALVMPHTARWEAPDEAASSQMLGIASEKSLLSGEIGQRKIGLTVRFARYLFISDNMEAAIKLLGFAAATCTALAHALHS